MNELVGEIEILHWVIISLTGKKGFLFTKLNYTFVLTLKNVPNPDSYFCTASEYFLWFYIWFGIFPTLLQNAYTCSKALKRQKI